MQNLQHSLLYDPQLNLLGGLLHRLRGSLRDIHLDNLPVNPRLNLRVNLLGDLLCCQLDSLLGIPQRILLDSLLAFLQRSLLDSLLVFLRLSRLDNLLEILPGNHLGNLRRSHQGNLPVDPAVSPLVNLVDNHQDNQQVNQRDNPVRVQLGDQVWSLPVNLQVNQLVNLLVFLLDSHQEDLLWYQVGGLLVNLLQVPLESLLANLRYNLRCSQHQSLPLLRQLLCRLRYPQYRQRRYRLCPMA